jgi:hypothetical protein
LGLLQTNDDVSFRCGVLESSSGVLVQERLERSEGVEALERNRMIMMLQNQIG